MFLASTGCNSGHHHYFTMNELNDVGPYVLIEQANHNELLFSWSVLRIDSDGYFCGRMHTGLPITFDAINPTSDQVQPHVNGNQSGQPSSNVIIEHKRDAKQALYVMFDPSGLRSQEEAVYCFVLTKDNRIIRFRWKMSIGEICRKGIWSPCNTLPDVDSGESIAVRAKHYDIENEMFSKASSLLDSIIPTSDETRKTRRHILISQFIEVKRQHESLSSARLTTTQSWWAHEKKAIALEVLLQSHFAGDELKLNEAQQQCVEVPLPSHFAGDELKLNEAQQQCVEVPLPSHFAGYELKLNKAQQQCVLQNGFLEAWQGLKSESKTAEDYCLALYVIIKYIHEEFSIFPAEIEIPAYLRVSTEWLRRFFLFKPLEALTAFWGSTTEFEFTYADIQCWMIALVYNELQKYKTHSQNESVKHYSEADYVAPGGLYQCCFGSIKRDTERNSDSNSMQLYCLMMNDPDAILLRSYSLAQLTKLQTLCEAILFNHESGWRTKEELEVLLQAVEYDFTALYADLENLINRVMDEIDFKRRLQTVRLLFRDIPYRERHKPLTAEQLTQLFDTIGTVYDYQEIKQNINNRWQHEILFNAFYNRDRFKSLVKTAFDFYIMISCLDTAKQQDKIIYRDQSIDYWLDTVHDFPELLTYFGALQFLSHHVSHKIYCTFKAKINSLVMTPSQIVDLCGKVHIKLAQEILLGLPSERFRFELTPEIVRRIIFIFKNSQETLMLFLQRVPRDMRLGEVMKEENWWLLAYNDQSLELYIKCLWPEDLKFMFPNLPTLNRKFFLLFENNQKNLVKDILERLATKYVEELLNSKDNSVQHYYQFIIQVISNFLPYNPLITALLFHKEILDKYVQENTLENNHFLRDLSLFLLSEAINTPGSSTDDLFVSADVLREKERLFNYFKQFTGSETTRTNMLFFKPDYSWYSLIILKVHDHTSLKNAVICMQLLIAHDHIKNDNEEKTPDFKIYLQELSLTLQNDGSRITQKRKRILGESAEDTGEQQEPETKTLKIGNW